MGGQKFSDQQMDYKSLQAGDRQSKVDFFDLVLAKTTASLQAAGVDSQIAPPAITSAEILGGKNTRESNRLLQIMCLLALRKKLGANMGGLVSCGDQWVTKYKASWSEDGKAWNPFASQGHDGEAAPPKILEIEGNADPEEVRFYALGLA